MKSKYIHVSILAFFLVSCDVPTQNFVRENPKDPMGGGFEVEILDGLDVKVDSLGHVLLAWPSVDLDIDGILVLKSLDGDDVFTEMGVLDRSETKYKDTSG